MKGYKKKNIYDDPGKLKIFKTLQSDNSSSHNGYHSNTPAHSKEVLRHFKSVAEHRRFVAPLGSGQGNAWSAFST